MVSHIDDDHINGILELTGELVEAKQARKPLALTVRKFWHNSFGDIIGNSPQELRKAVTAAFGAASLDGEPDAEGLEPAAAKVLASASQGPPWVSTIIRHMNRMLERNRVDPAPRRRLPKFMTQAS